jgi:hypothetical protein
MPKRCGGIAAADQGNAGAQFGLSVMYANGQGVPQDYAQAARWCRKAADQGDTAAQVFLGSMYANGQGVPRDYAGAIRLLRPLAEQGDASAQFFLGLMYMKGEGVPQDHAQAYKWFTLAASQSSVVQQVHDEAVKARDFVATKMTPDDGHPPLPSRPVGVSARHWPYSSLWCAGVGGARTGPGFASGCVSGSGNESACGRSRGIPPMSSDAPETDDFETRWPKDGDHLFRDFAWAYDARVVRDPAERFYRMPMGYKRAGDILIDQATTDVVDRANVIYAALFCYRQSIELFLKSLIDAFGNAKVYLPKITHERSFLWERFMCIVNERGSGESIGLSAVQRLVAEMHEADQKSDGFRFPTDRNGDPFVFGDRGIDLKNLREVMQGLVNFFECSYLDFSHQDDIAAEAGWWFETYLNR